MAFAGETARFVVTNHVGRTDISRLAFVDVRTSLRSADVTFGTLTLLIDTRLSCLAIKGAVTTRSTEFVNANLSLQAVLVLDTDLQADSVDTLLASCTVGIDVALKEAVTIVALVIGGTFVS